MCGWESCTHDSFTISVSGKTAEPDLRYPRSDRCARCQILRVKRFDESFAALPGTAWPANEDV